VQAHFVEDGIPLVGVVFQPEVFLPLQESAAPIGRLVSAIRGGGAFARRSRYRRERFVLTSERRVVHTPRPSPAGFVACVPMSTKMSPSEHEMARRVHNSGIVAVTTGAGGAAANVMMAVFGGHHVYANFGAGEDLDLIPPQLIALEAGLTVWGIHRNAPVWNLRKQPVIVAPDPESAEAFLKAAGL
jgi:3'-phosphoadenosine 5'-phosphosulfate (PAPS) 3'-phosphatase